MKTNNKLISFALHTLFFFILNTFQHQHTAAEGSRVLELSDRFLDIRKDGIWLVKFYAPWCGHCKKLEPIYAHVAQALHDSPIRVGRVDCTRFPSVGQEFKVSGFPTIIFMKGDHTHVYNGERETAEIVKYAKRMAGPAVRDLDAPLPSPDDDQEQQTNHHHTKFFAFIGKPELHPELWSAFQDSALRHQPTLDFFTIPEHHPRVESLLNSPSSSSSSSPSSLPAVISFKDKTSTVFVPTSANLTESMQHFILTERFPKFVKVSRTNFQNLLATKKFLVIVVVEEDKLGNVGEEADGYRQLFKDFVAQHHQQTRHNFQFGWCGSPELANSVAMATLPLPSLLVVNSTSYHHHFPTEKIENFQHIHDLLNNLTNQALQAYGGNTWGVRLYRTFYEGKTSLYQMWAGNPVLTALLFGLPLGFMSLICYSICCADILDSNDEDELVGSPHEKKE